MKTGKIKIIILEFSGVEIIIYFGYYRNGFSRVLLLPSSKSLGDRQHLSSKNLLEIL
ncbi:Hypothetical protein POVR1_LOCUS395 [uncultured virus]|nr:Hypothetical protein POVR1_LOCUS395 [uncultured virus]